MIIFIVPIWLFVPRGMKSLAPQSDKLDQEHKIEVEIFIKINTVNQKNRCYAFTDFYLVSHKLRLSSVPFPVRKEAFCFRPSAGWSYFSFFVIRFYNIIKAFAIFLLLFVNFFFVRIAVVASMLFWSRLS